MLDNSPMPDSSPPQWACFDMIGRHVTDDWMFTLYPSGKVNLDGENFNADYRVAGAVRIWNFPNGHSIHLYPNGHVYYFVGDGEKPPIGSCEKRGAW